MTERGAQAPLTPRNADGPQTGMDAGSALKTRQGTEPDGTGTSGNIENAPPTVADRYGAGVEKAGVRHTPGPWHACKDGACTCKAVWCADHPIADVTSGEWGDEYPAIRLDQEGIGAKAEAYMERLVYGSIDPAVAAANARLIAAAPDMLDTERRLAAEVGGLRAFEHEIRAAIGNTNWSLLMQRLTEADAAIAKATLPTPGGSDE